MRDSVPDVTPVAATVELDHLLSSYGAAGVAAPFIDDVVAGRVCRHQCGITITIHRSSS